MKQVLNNQNGHGQVPSGKDILKFLGILITFPVSIPMIKLVEKIKEKKNKKRDKDER